MISINTNGYSTYSVQNQSTYRLQDQLTINNEIGSQSDSLSISQEALAYMSSTQNSTILPSGNYTNTVRTEPLTTEEMSSFLTRMVEKLSSTTAEGTAESDTTSQRAVALSTLKETLSGVDLTSATDEEIQSLFTSVTDLLKEARPPKGGHHGPPPVEGTEAVTASLSTDQASSTFTSIIDQLTSSEEDEEEVASVLASLQETLSGVDLSSTSEDEVDNLFEIVMGLLDKGISVPEEITADQKKSILAEIISKLNSTEEEIVETEETATETITM